MGLPPGALATQETTENTLKKQRLYEAVYDALLEIHQQEASSTQKIVKIWLAKVVSFITCFDERGHFSASTESENAENDIQVYLYCMN